MSTGQQQCNIFVLKTPAHRKLQLMQNTVAHLLTIQAYQPCYHSLPWLLNQVQDLDPDIQGTPRPSPRFSKICKALG